MQEYYLHESLPRVPDPNYKCPQGSQLISQDMPPGLFPPRPKTHDTACLTNVFMEDIDILQSSNVPVIKTSPTKKHQFTISLQLITHHQIEELIGISMHQIEDEREYAQAEEIYLLIRDPPLLLQVRLTLGYNSHMSLPVFFKDAFVVKSFTTIITGKSVLASVYRQMVIMSLFLYKGLSTVLTTVF